MTNGPDDQPGQDLPPPPPPPPPGGGRGLFARNDPDQPGPPPQDRPPRQDPRVRQPQQQQPEQGTDDNPFLLPNERDRMPVYGAPPLPVVPLVLILLAIAVGAALFVMSREEKAEGGISAQQAASSLVLRMDGVDITEDAFRREIATGISKGRIPCDKLAGQPADNIAAGLRLGVLRMEVPSASGVAQKKDQKADDSSLLLAAQIVLESCPKGAAPAPAQQQNPPGGQPVPAATQAPAPGGQPSPAGTQAPAPAGTARPATPGPAPAATVRPNTTPAPPAPAPGR